MFAQGVQVTATPSRNRRKDFCSRLPPASKEVPSPEEIPPSSGLRAPDSLVKARAPLAVVSDDYSTIMKRNVLPSVEQTPTRGSTKLTNPLRKSAHALTTIEQTPSRGASKISNPLHLAAVNDTSEPRNFLAPPTRIPEGLPSPRHFLGKSQVSELTPSWPLEVHETPSKRPSLKQNYFPFGEWPQETLLKPSGMARESPKAAGQEPREMPVQPAKAAKASSDEILQSVLPAVHTSTEELDISIYQSLGWDEVDELS